MKTFVLDTNVLLHDYTCLSKFQDNHIVIPVAVLEELDRFKTGSETINFAAREVLRQIESLDGDLIKGVSVGEGLLSIHLDGPKLDSKITNNFSTTVTDHRVLNTAYVTKAILVTKDINLRVKARALGLTAQDYSTDKVEPPRPQTLMEVDPEFIDSLCEEPQSAEGMYENQYFIFRSGKKSALSRVKQGQYHRITSKKAYGIEPRNAEQTMALDALFDPDVPLVALTGKAGSGKTLIALAAAFEQKRNFQQIFVARPIIPLSNKDMGFLPGDIKEKLDPYMQPILDNIGVIKAQFKKTEPKYKAIEDMLKEEKIVITPLAYIRGRSLSNIFFLVDEAQNTTPHEIKTIVTRMGENVKLIFTGDVEQIDQPYLDKRSNGLSYLIDRMQGQPLFAHIHLEKGERSQLAELASQLL